MGKIFGQRQHFFLSIAATASLFGIRTEQIFFHFAVACWAYAFGLRFLNFSSKLQKTFHCDSSKESKLSLFIFLSGLYKRRVLEESDLERFHSSIVLLNRLITGPVDSFYMNFRSIVEQQLTSCERTSFHIASFEAFLSHLEQDIVTAEKILYSIIHNNSLLTVLTNPYQYEILHALNSVSRSSHHRQILKAKRIFKSRKVRPVKSDLLIEQDSCMYNLPLELIIMISEYLSSSAKVAYMLTCKKFFYIGRTLFSIKYENWNDIKMPVCKSFKTVKSVAQKPSECKCLLCLSFCPCEYQDFADYMPLKKFLFSTVVFDTLHLQTRQDLKIFNQCIKNVPKTTKVTFPVNLIDLQNLFTQRIFTTLDYTIDIGTHYFEAKAIEIKTYFTFPFVKNLVISFSGVTGSNSPSIEQRTVCATIVKGHLEVFLEKYHSQKLETLYVSECQFIDQIFTAQQFRSDFTWYRSLRILDISNSKMSCKMLKFVKEMDKLEALFLKNITIDEHCAPDHFNRYLRSDFLNLKYQNGLYFPKRSPPVQIFADVALQCNCQNVDLTPENFEQHRRSMFDIPVCIDCTLNFGCG